MKNKLNRIPIIIFLFCGFLTNSVAQEQEGGVKNIFNGAGARQMALGGAVIAYPQDPTTIFWNPAGMEYLSQKSFSLFYASYLDGAAYNFVGYVHPTLNIGTFGIGVSRIGVGDIPLTEFTPEVLGTFSADQNEFYLSYAKIIKDLFSFGLNFKLNRHVIDNMSDVGFGVDLSLMYLPEFDNFFTRDLRLGLTIQNAYSPRLNPGDGTDFIPHRILFGLAKPLSLGDNQKPLYFLFSAEKGALESIKFKAGLEFAYQDLGMLRFGYNQNEGLAFGAGAVYQKFQFDYAYGQLSDVKFATSHRISFTVNFGKTKHELLEIVIARRQREVNEQLAIQREKERQDNIKRYLREGNQFFANEDYLEAKIKFRQVLDIDLGNLEADSKIDECDTLIEEKQQQDLQKALDQEFEDKVREDLRVTILAHLDRGNAYLTDGKYDLAIAEYQAALGKLPEDESSISIKENIENSIEQARSGLNQNIEDLIRQADNLAKRNEMSEAIQYLGRAQGLTGIDSKEYEEITKKISQLETKLSAYEFYQQGIIAYNDKAWKTARINFDKARRLSPNDPEILNFYVESERREKARNMDLSPEIRERFYNALSLYADGKYKDAVDIYKELLEIQPYNKLIWDNLDRAREELRKQQRK